MKSKDTNQTYKTVFIKITVFLLCTLCFAALAYDVAVGNYVMESFDKAMFFGIRHLKCNFITVFFKLMTNTVHPVVILLVSIAMIHFLRQRKYLVALLGNVLLTVLLNMATKGAIMRVRPPQDWRLVAETGYSFPSGHSMVAASFYGFLIFMIWQSSMTRKQKKVGTILCVVTIALVGMSRIYLGVHYATDVIGGFLVSTMYLLCYTAIVKKYLETEGLLMGKSLLDKHRLLRSFKYAFEGMFAGLKREKNMMIHYSALIAVVIFGLTLQITKMEWIVCLLLCGLVIAMEQMNTALEAAVDLVTEENKPLAKLAKDTAAGAVLVAAITAAIIGTMIFLPKLMILLHVNMRIIG